VIGVQSEALIFATHNPGKVEELAALLAPLGLECLGAGALGLPPPDEIFETFAENAALKAREAYGATGQPAIGDDSGLVVWALDGAPGVHTARFAGPERDFRAAMTRLEALLDAKGPSVDRRAELVCALHLEAPGLSRGAEARLGGKLVWPPRGDGPGFEPIFVPEGGSQTLAELPATARLWAHPRAAAVAKLEGALRSLAHHLEG
jgi:XTP/dITP diphosphohydrolase